MHHYRQHQTGWLILAIFLPVQLLLALAYLNQWGTNPLTLTFYLLTSLLFWIVILAFFRMKILIDEKHIMLRFGMGMFAKKISIADIEKIRLVKGPWYAAGIISFSGGWLYSVNGGQAVEIVLKDRTDYIRFGSPDAETLQRQIHLRLNAGI